MNRLTRRLVLGIALLLAGQASAEDPTAGGGQAGQFLSWGAGARALGMGKAFVGVGDDASATYWNPAGMGQMERKELSALHAILWSQTSFDFLSFVYPHPTLGAFGGNITRLSSGGFEEVDASNNPTGGTFSDNHTAFTAAYGRSLTDVVSVGVGMKYVVHSLGAFSNSFFGMDLSLMNRIPSFRGFRAGLKLSNLVAGTIGDTEDRLPVVARLGTSYKTLKDKLLIALDLDQTFREKQRPGWHAGTEYWVLNYAALRLGFEGGKGAGLRETTAGFGVKYRDYGLDYAVGLHSLGASHRIAANWQFGKSTKQKAEEEARNFYREGIEAYRAGAYLLAREKLTSALDIDPRNREIQEMLAKVQVVGGAIGLATGDTQEEALIRKGASSYIEGDPATAVNVLQSALAQAPANDKLRGLLRQIAKEVKIEVPSVAPAATAVPGLTWKEKKLAKALDHFYKGEYELVINECQDVLSVDPADTTALKRVGSAYWMLGIKDKARTTWQRVLQIAPNDPDVPELLQQK